MKTIEMIKGAKKLVEECTRVKEGENVLIVTDMVTPLTIAEVLAIACKERGAEPTVVIMSPPTKEHEGDPPPPVAEAMMKSQVIFLACSESIFSSASRVRATNAGARCFNFSGFAEEDLVRGAIEANFLETKDLVEKVASALGKAKEAQVTTALGTDLYLDFRGRLERLLRFNALCHEPGDAKSINLEAAVSPTVGKARGTIVCDGSVTLFKPGLIQEPVRATVRDGMITEIRGGREARNLARLLASTGDPMVYNLSEFAIGLNPKAILTGVPPQDRGVYGTCHIGFGSNVNWGGKIKAATHFDFVINAPKVELDGVTMLEDFRFHL